MTHEIRDIGIKEFAGLYKVDDQGNVWRKLKGSVKTSCGWRGYQVVTLCNGEHKGYQSVHRLVAEAFVPNPDNKPYVNHKNNDSSDNRAANLEWCDQKENMIHCSESNRARKGPIVPVVAIDKDGNRTDFPSIKKAAETLGNKNRSVIRRAILRQGTAYGY